MSWVLEAIEKEAMTRAFEKIRKHPSTFSYMGYSEDQIRVILLSLEDANIIHQGMSLDNIGKIWNVKVKQS